MTTGLVRKLIAGWLPLRGRRYLTPKVLLAMVILASPGLGRAQTNDVDALIHAIRWRDLARVREILASGIDFNLPDGIGSTPLDEAIANHFPSLAIEMIRRGADVNLRPGILASPLATAAETCQKEVLVALLEHGAEVNRQEPDGDTALIIASGYCKDGKIVQILLNAGANPNASDSVGYTPLINAADEGNERAAKKLIAAGADLNARDSDGETALVIARDRPFRTKAHDRVYALLLKASRKGAGKGAKEAVPCSTTGWKINAVVKRFVCE